MTKGEAILQGICDGLRAVLGAAEQVKI